MIAVRLPEILEEKLNSFSSRNHKTKTEVVKEALMLYFETRANEEKKTLYELGESLFGKYASGEDDLSTTYKKRLKGKLNEKYRLDR